MRTGGSVLELKMEFNGIFYDSSVKDYQTGWKILYVTGLMENIAIDV